MFLTSWTAAILLKPVCNLMTLAKKILQILHWGFSAAVNYSNISFICFKLLLSLTRCVSHCTTCRIRTVVWHSKTRQPSSYPQSSDLHKHTCCLQQPNKWPPQANLPPPTTQQMTPTGTLPASNSPPNDPIPFLTLKGGPLRNPEGDFLWSCRNYIN